MSNFQRWESTKCGGALRGRSSSLRSDTVFQNKSHFFLYPPLNAMLIPLMLVAHTHQRSIPDESYRRIVSRVTLSRRHQTGRLSERFRLSLKTWESSWQKLP
jgi:hypothetical protein